MQQMTTEISEYIKYTDLELKTKKRYEKRLLEFTKHLSEITNQSMDEVNLNKIYFIPYDENLGLDLPIDHGLIDKFLMANLSQGYSWLSLTTASLQSFFRYLSTKYDIRNIMRDIDFKLKDHYVEPKNKRIFNRQEILKFVRSILTYSENDTLVRDTLLFITLFTTGCRINEILSLTPSDVIVDNHTFLLKKTKNKRQMYVATKIGLTDCLKTYCQINSIKKDQKIFQHNNRPMTQRMVSTLLQHYSEKASLPKTRVHDTRGSFITTMYENGSDLSIIQQMVNHISMGSTQVYLSDNAIRNKYIVIPVYEKICSELKSLVSIPSAP